jgi:hypothetical protein
MILLFSGVTQEMITVGRAQGKILQPRNYSDFIAQRSGVKRKQCAETLRAIREVMGAKAATAVRVLTSAAGVVKHVGDDVLIVPLSPDAQTRFDQKFVRKVVIGDLRFGFIIVCFFHTRRGATSRLQIFVPCNSKCPAI